MLDILPFAFPISHLAPASVLCPPPSMHAPSVSLSATPAFRSSSFAPRGREGSRSTVAPPSHPVPSARCLPYLYHLLSRCISDPPSHTSPPPPPENPPSHQFQRHSHLSPRNALLLSVSHFSAHPPSSLSFLVSLVALHTFCILTPSLFSIHQS